jgi:hypothetical protein
VISLADGTVAGPDSQFAEMHLSGAQPAHRGIYVGTTAGALVSMSGPPSFRNATTWPEFGGRGGAGATLPNCNDPDLTWLLSEYTPALIFGLELTPGCPTFVATDGSNPSFVGPHGVGSVHFSLEQLNGNLIYDRDGNVKPIENEHGWAIVTHSLREGLDRLWEAADGFTLNSAYRNPYYDKLADGHKRDLDGARIAGLKQDLGEGGLD